MADDKLAGITTRQKAIAAGFVVVVLIIIWQVIGLFGGGNKPASPPPPAPSAVPKATPTAAGGNPPPPAAGPAAPGGGGQMAAGAPGGGEAPQLLPQVNVMTGPTVDKKMMEAQQQNQKQFIQDLSQLQLLKVQREIAEANQAIAAANLAKATSDRDRNDILTKQSAPPPTVPAGAYASSLISPIQSGAPTEAGPPPQQQAAPPPQPTPPPQPAPVPETPYVVISVTMELNRWSAVLGFQGKLFNVSIGDQLPDGSTVSSISRSGVTLKRDNQERKVSLVSTI